MTAQATYRSLVCAGLTLVALASACVPSTLLEPTVKGPTDAPKVVVLKSNANAIYDAPAQSFVSQMSEVASVYVEVVDEEGGLPKAVAELQPALVYALGTKAALVARSSLPDTPVLFAMVLNYKRHQELKTPMTMGVALEVPPYVELLQFKLPLQGMRKLLVIYSEANAADIVAEAKQVAGNIGLELVTVPVKTASDVPSVFDKHVAAVDSVWLLNDPVVMNPQAFGYLRQASLKHGKVLVSSLSDEFARAGAVLSVSVDLKSLGYQAASLARSVVEKVQLPQEIGVQPPIGARLVLNMAVAKKLGLAIPDEVMPLINEVVLTERSSE